MLKNTNESVFNQISHILSSLEEMEEEPEKNEMKIKTLKSGLSLILNQKESS